MLPQHVPPPPVQEAVQDVGGDDVGQRVTLTLKSRLEHQSVDRQHGAHVSNASVAEVNVGCVRKGAPVLPPPTVRWRMLWCLAASRSYISGCVTPCLITY